MQSELQNHSWKRSYKTSHTVRVTKSIMKTELKINHEIRIIKSIIQSVTKINHATE